MHRPSLLALVSALPLVVLTTLVPPANAEAPAGNVRRDPAGIKGVSPAVEAVSQGDRAFVARDFERAADSYRAAITSEPENPLGHLRMSELALARGDLSEAEQAIGAALRYAKDGSAQKGQAMFLLAVLRERQRATDDALERWQAYLEFCQKNPLVKTFPATALERKQRIERHKQLVAEYAAVKERIKERLAEADRKARENAR
jgi:tetratricopeptide (TPR) repeat protein